MGMYGSAQVMYGFLLDEDDIEKIKNEVDFEDDAVYDWASDNNLNLDIGGDARWDEESTSYVVGRPVGGWISDLGAHELEDDFGVVPPEVIEEMKAWEDHFGRPAKRFLVTSYG